MTPYEQLGYTAETKFRIVGSTGGHDFPLGTIVTLKRDDGDDEPKMQDEHGESHYVDLHNDIEPLEPPKVQHGNAPQYKEHTYKITPVDNGYIYVDESQTKVFCSRTYLADYLASVLPEIPQEASV